MGKAITRIVLGLAIASGSLGMAGSAHATVWRNRANESFCLSTGNNGSMSPGTGLIIWKCNTDLGKPVADQDWGQVSAPWDSSFSYFSLYNTRVPATPPPFNANTRCAGTKGGWFDNGTQIIIASCSPANAISHDQGFHLFNQGLDSNRHQCYSFFNEMSFENPSDPDHITQRVFGVSGGSMTNGSAVILWDYFKDSTGHSTHPDQIWCAY